MMPETWSGIAERLLAAVTAAIGGGSYPRGGERSARVGEALGGPALRGHTLGGCRFIRWRGRVLVTRELAKAAPLLHLRAGERIIWDRRFEIMTPPADSGPFTIGYLGLAETQRLDRRLPQLRRAGLPRLLVPAIPAVADAKGIAGVPRLGSRREGVAAMP